MHQVKAMDKVGQEMKYTSGKIFIDTNILIYSIDKNDYQKLETSRLVISELTQHQAAVISTQVINEFYVVATKKLKSDALAVKRLISSFNQFEIVNPDIEIIKDAIDISILNKISYWDALILSSALSAKCNSVYSEDMNDGQLINGIKIINPFSKAK